MSVIGGYFGGGSKRCDSAALSEISRSMHIHGGLREAFIKGRTGIAVGLNGGEADSSGLYMLEREGEVYAAVISGELLSGGGDGLLSAYVAQGWTCEPPLGTFSCALCNGRGELLVFRLGEGSPPLYYGEHEGDFAFASSIHGLSGFLGGCYARLGVLRDHLTAAVGKYGAEDLYVGICGVRRDSGLLFATDGVSRVFFKSASEGAFSTYGSDAGQGFICPTPEKMRELLADILMAFGYPQFDAFMPTFIHCLKQGTSIITDHSLCMDTAYSEKRRERIFALCGRRAAVIPPVAQDYGEAELRLMEGMLRSILEEDETEVYARALGKDWRGVIEREKNTVRRIRTEGMLWQTAFWYNKYNVSFI